MYEFVSICKPFLIGLSFLFVICLVFYSIYLLIVTMKGSIKIRKNQEQSRLSNRLTHEYYVPISLLVPVGKNDKNIVGLVSSLLQLEYKLYEIIVIADEVDYKTMNTFLKKFHMKQIDRPIQKLLATNDISDIYQAADTKVKVTLLKKDRGGVGDAINAGINASEYPYFVCVKPNCYLPVGSLENLARPILENDLIALCTGMAKPISKYQFQSKNYLNDLPKEILVGAQSLEYHRIYHCHCQNLFENRFDLFRKEIVISLLGFDANGSGETFSLARKVEAYCREDSGNYQVKTVPDAFSFVECPANCLDIIHQRSEWHRSFLKSYFTQKDASGANSFFLFLFEILSPFFVLFSFLSIFLLSFFQFIDISSFLVPIFFYLLFLSTLTAHLYFVTLHARDKRCSICLFIRVVFLSFIEVVILKVLLFISKFVAFFKRKYNV